MKLSSFRSVGLGQGEARRFLVWCPYCKEVLVIESHLYGRHLERHNAPKDGASMLLKFLRQTADYFATHDILPQHPILIGRPWVDYYLQMVRIN